MAFLYAIRKSSYQWIFLRVIKHGVRYSKLWRKPSINSSPSEIRKFITDKYVKKLYANPAEDDPITRLKNGTYKPQK